MFGYGLCFHIVAFSAKKLPKTDPTQQRGNAPGGRSRVVDIEKDRSSDGGGGCCSKS